MHHRRPDRRGRLFAPLRVCEGRIIIEGFRSRLHGRNWGDLSALSRSERNSGRTFFPPSSYSPARPMVNFQLATKLRLVRVNLAGWLWRCGLWSAPLLVLGSLIAICYCNCRSGQFVLDAGPIVGDDFRLRVHVG